MGDRTAFADDLVTFGQIDRSILEFRLSERGLYMFPPPPARHDEPQADGMAAGDLTEARQVSLAQVGAIAITVVFGGHLLRVLVPTIGWYLRDVRQLGTIELIPYALVPFLVAFFAPLVHRLAGHRMTLTLTAATVLVARILEQVITDAAADLWIAAVGVAGFALAMPALVGMGAGAFSLGVTAGLTLDTALRGATRTLDLGWIDGWVPLIVVVALAAAGSIAVLRSPWWEPGWPGGWGAVALVGVPPLLLLQWLVLQNQGWLATVTGWSTDLALLSILAANAVGLVLASRPGPVPMWLRSIPGIAALVASWAAFAADGPLGGGLLLSATVLAPLLLRQLGTRRRRGPNPGAASTALGVGWLLFVVAAMVFYLSLDPGLFGIRNQSVLVAVGVVLALASVPAWFDDGRLPGSSRLVPAAAAALLVVPAVMALTDRPADGEPPRRGEMVAMTYNVHNGFDIAGRQNLEAMAQVIEHVSPDVVGLQELSRGWLLNGSTDMLAWFQHRLGYEHAAFVGTADPIWGNAVLSRHPITGTETGLLPLGTAPFRRGYLAATLDLPHAEDVLFVVTHLQHTDDTVPDAPDDETSLRPLHLEQMQTILEAWDGRSRTIFVGDFNARPGWAEMELAVEAGFEDAWSIREPDPGNTAGHWRNDGVARYRIDWILHTPDLPVTDARVVDDPVSDHLPVVATFTTD